MKYPNFLSKHDTIYLISPSFGCSTEPYKSRLNKAIENLNDLGFTIKKGKYIYNNEDLLSASKEELAEEFIEAYKSGDLLLSVGGGELMVSILEYIDFNLLKELPPKWFMGYSDNTNLTFLLTTICDVSSIYGANACEFGVDKFIDYQNNMVDIIKGKKLKFTNYKEYEINPLKSDENPYLNLNLEFPVLMSSYPLDNIYFEGRIIGGCIDSLSTLVGTKFDYVKEFSDKYKGIVWFFEACDMNIIEVGRRLIQMKYAGWFNNVSGFIFGRPLNNEPMFNNTHKSIIIDILSYLNVPIIFDADIGHLKPQIPILVGSYSKVGYKHNKLKIEYILK